MKKIFSILFLAIMCVCLLSCQKEITLPYRSIDPVLVVEGKINQDGACISLKKTVDMEAQLASSEIVKDAKVCVEYGNESVSFSQNPEDGAYYPNGDFVGVPGTTYTLKIESDGNVYTSSSRMNSPVEVIDHGFRCVDFAGLKTWMYSATVLDTPDEENYYVFYFYENDKIFSWDVLYDKGHDGEVLHFDVAIQMDDVVETGSEYFDTLPVGGKATLEIRSVDKKTYDYFYSLAVTMMTYGNALVDITGKDSEGEDVACLGFFSSFSSARMDEIFQREDTFVDSTIQYPEMD